eukprot:9312227-Alexandrium_andersonii.AAC.1
MRARATSVLNSFLHEPVRLLAGDTHGLFLPPELQEARLNPSLFVHGVRGRRASRTTGLFARSAHSRAFSSWSRTTGAIIAGA